MREEGAGGGNEIEMACGVGTKVVGIAPVAPSSEVR